MSIQLIVFPQSYEGSPNPLAANSTQFLVDGINFNTVSASTSFTATAPFEQNAVNNYAPTLAVNQWVRYIESGGVAPTGANGQLDLATLGGDTTGLMQRLSNLTVGDVYDVTFDIDAVTSVVSPVLTLNSYTGTILNSSSVIPMATGTVTVQFTANSTTDIIVLNLTATGIVRFNSISVLNATATASGNTSHLGDGQVICDLYEDEDIPLSLSVDDFKNVAEKVQSYSKAFNLPATKRNNKIFDNIFEITRSADGVIFNPYKKTQCVLKQDGFILFEGYLRLLDVTDKEGEVSFNVNLYSEVVALADLLKDRAFRDLDFTELEHDYNRTQITYSWNDSGTGITYTNPSTSGFRNAFTTVKYPFVDWSHQILVGGSTGTNAISGNPELTVLEQAFRPFININYLIDRIFEPTPFTYTSTFLENSDFQNLYMDFNWGSAQAPNDNLGEGFGENDNTTGVTAGLTPTQIPFDVEDFTNASDLGFDVSTSRFTASFDNQVYFIQGVFKFSYSGYTSGQLGYLGWEKYDNTGAATGYFPINNQLFPINTSSSFGNISSSFNQTVILNTGESLRPSFYKLDAGVTLTQLTTQQLSAFSSNGVTVITGTSTTTSETLLQTLRGELGQWDFLKGILTMFNLVTLPDEDNPNNIKIEPYADVFLNSSDSVPLDWTDKIDVSEMKLEPLADLNKKTIFKFVEDDDDFAFTNYKNQVGGHLYGSKRYDAGNEFNILQGEDEIVAEPFAATVVKPLMSQFSSFITPAMYSYNSDDGTSEGFDNSPRIMYNNGIKDTGASYYIPAQNGVTSSNEEDFLQFSHLSDIPTILQTAATTGSRDFHFGECQLLTGVGDAVPDNLFNLYWLPYYSELYNPNTRIMTIKVNLTPADINTFKFNDTVYLKNREFRVNKIDYKPNDLATVEFILIP